MTFEELKQKALSLPYQPGVYLMQDKQGTVIYVGKAKKLHNRVSQYFQDSSAHTPKTRKMVSNIDHFDTIVARSEFEALVLECSLIKRHMPKYNILLKDDKGYPYLRIDLKQEYPVMELSNRVSDDGASYFGPFGGRYITQKVIDTLCKTFRLPLCSKKFPKDIGRDRVCLNFHMNHCDGWCQKGKDAEEYRRRILQAVKLLQGNYSEVSAELRSNMEQAAEKLEFERAAELRDRLSAIESLGQKQLVTAGRMADMDVIGYAKTEAKACFAVLHFLDGNLIDKEYEIVELTDDEQEAVSSLTKQFYMARKAAPREILLPYEMEDADLFSQLLLEQLGRKVTIRTPQRGDNRRLLELSQKNAMEEAERLTTKAERLNGTVKLLSDMLGHSLHRLEAYDISNIAGTDIVASMTVFQDGKPKKSDYKKFKLKGLEDQDDYASMRQVLNRRFTHYQAGDKGFDEFPDALLIDGGIVHAEAVREEIEGLGISLPIYGMVKDNRHRTRALVTPDGKEISISSIPAVFAFIGRIQEETHRFAITYHRSLRSKRITGSTLSEIPGIGETRSKALLKHFKSITAIRAARLSELEKVLPKNAAQAVYDHFHSQE
ncbi:MAG: excinuclease ABC subunit UvrC [Clostridia bacterium]|nr:excinuclease ABC subunit UvrC [Clostridia bacterium]